MNVLEDAIAFATVCHSGQTRKMSKTPYILHPLEVASIIATMTDDIEIMAAGVLHDTVEDCGADPKELKMRFGSRVSALVQSETEDKLSTRPPADTWKERKEESLLMLDHTKDIGVKMLWLSDKLSNMRSFYRTFLKEGNGLWQYTNQKDPAEHAWYYRTILEHLTELSDTCAYAEFSDLVAKIFTNV